MWQRVQIGLNHDGAIVFVAHSAGIPCGRALFSIKRVTAQVPGEKFNLIVSAEQLLIPAVGPLDLHRGLNWRRYLPERLAQVLVF